jgi:NadR type nicotinamide-nucleotide adenylyltransferase
MEDQHALIRKFVVVGPESTGKSTLCAQLAAHFNCSWVDEYAREYLLRNGTDYSFENLLEIAKGQLALEDSAIEMVGLTSRQKPGLVFIDTNMYVLKVWCEFVFDKCHEWILNQIVERKYDGYLLCDIDLPWVKDELREYPDLLTRKILYHHYKDILVNQPLPWVNISGDYSERLKKAISAIDSFM